MYRFECEGSKWDSFWLVNGSIDFSIIQGGSTPHNENDTPVRLQVGHMGMGVKHIENKHSHWIKKHKPTVPEFLHFKLGQKGGIYTSNHPERIEITLHTHPRLLLVLGYTTHHTLENFFTVITMFYHKKSPQGRLTGFYLGF